MSKTSSASDLQPLHHNGSRSSVETQRIKAPQEDLILFDRYNNQ
jgi:hypothetical protein